ncbi:SANT/Myb-like DNA-binding domain-containing protein [Thermoproteota archaeon]
MVKIKEWSDEEIERLRELYTSNRTFDEIKEKFPSRTGNAIRLKASRLNIKRPLIGNVVQVKPLLYKLGETAELSGYLMKCKECGSWIQVNAESQHNANVLSCGKCGIFYQVLADL